ncbi:MAG: prepilin-type N-terminal cleavage/methylation domain-containing protein [Planctomycetes bacterium]|nr:prepilin-type N-terminal cleavage/methylation domain-containing protein [Planctomycetota bacterium]
MRKAFTLLEMVVAVALMAVVMAIAGSVFRAGIQAVRLASANAEIMETFRVITNQLDADFRGLTKESDVFVVWAADAGGQQRFDRIMFHALGDFPSYDGGGLTRGNTARISYTLAGDANGRKAHEQSPVSRTLVRTQHAYIPKGKGVQSSVFDPLEDSVTESRAGRLWYNEQQFDNLTLKAWNDIPRPQKDDLLSIVGDVNVADAKVPRDERGAWIDRSDADTLHMLLAERVGQFSIQGRRTVNGSLRRWPMADPDNDGAMDDSDFDTIGSGDATKINTKHPMWSLYSDSGRRTHDDPDVTYASNSGTSSAGIGDAWDLGPDLLFTFTLYDSQGLIEGGRTLTHRVGIR